MTTPDRDDLAPLPPLDTSAIPGDTTPLAEHLAKRKEDKTPQEPKLNSNN